VKKFTLVSLFSGAGGLDVGFVQSGGFNIIFANDILQPAVQTHSTNLKLNFSSCAGDRVDAQPGTALACNVELVDFSPLGGADVVIGGPPCQDFSIVRGPEWNRRGIEVKRGRLYAHFVRALAVLQPKAFLFENVPGLATANKGLASKVILEDLSSLNSRWEEVEKIIGTEGLGKPAEGYEIIFSGIIDFSQFGVPQKRERLIIVGVRKDLVRSVEKLLEAKSIFLGMLKKTMSLFAKYPLTPIEVFEGKRLDELNSVYREVMEKWNGVWLEVETEKAWRWKAKVWDRLMFRAIDDYLTANTGSSSRDELNEALKRHEEVLQELGYYGVPVSSVKLADGSQEFPREDSVVAERMKRIPPGENYEFVRGTKWEVKSRISSFYRRLYPLKPAYTILAYGGGGTYGYHYDRDRTALTLREKARLQTFPDTFIFSGSKTEIRAQIGEAVPPLAAKKLACALAEVLNRIKT
jgi:DNA (cytosine-5)-methyltransferase 1